MDGLVAVVWLSVNLALAAGAYTAVRRSDAGAAWWDELAATIIVVWSAVVLACFILSELHLLTGPSVLTAGVVVAGAVWGWLFFSRPGRATGRGQRPSGWDALPCPDRRWSVFWLLFGSMAAACAVVGGLAGFPTDWDGLMYHLSLPDYWLQAQRLHAPGCPVWYNPSTNELLTLWAVAPFSGDFFAAFTNLPGCLALACGALGLSRELGVRGILSHLTALATVSTYVWQRQLVDNENDVAVAGLFLCCLLFGCRYARLGTWPDLFLSAASFGLLAGVKYYASGYAAVAGSGVLAITAAERGRRAAARAALVGLVAVALLGAYWYVRNARLTGTPFYPFGVTGETNKLGAYYPDTWRSTFLGNGRPELLPLAFRAVEQMAGPYHVAAVAAFPFLLAWLAVTASVWRRSVGVRPAGRWLLSYTMAGAVAVLAITPWAVETQPGTLNCLVGAYIPTRFGQCFLALAVVAVGVLLSDLGLVANRNSRLSGARWALQCVLDLLPAGLVGWQFVRLADTFEGKPALSVEAALAGLNLALAVAVCYLAWRVGSWPCRLLLVLGIPAVVVAACGGAEAQSGRWHAGFGPFYDRMFQTHVHARIDGLSPRPARVCVLDYRDYPFFGSRRQWTLFRPPMVRSEEELVQYVRENEVDVVVATAHDPFSIPRYQGAAEWLRRRPDLFVPLDADRSYVLVRVNRVRLREPAVRPGEVRDRVTPSL